MSQCWRLAFGMGDRLCIDLGIWVPLFIPQFTIFPTI